MNSAPIISISKCFQKLSTRIVRKDWILLLELPHQNILYSWCQDSRMVIVQAQSETVADSMGTAASEDILKCNYR